MTTTPFQLVDNQTFLPSDISSGAVFISPEQSSGVGDDLSTGVQVVIDYHDLQSFPAGAALQAVMEGKSDGGQFYTIAHQFEAFSLVGVQQRRQIVMSQDLIVVDQGLDSFVFVAGATIEQISRQHGVMPSIWRLRVNIRDQGSSFVSVRMSIYGRRFNSSIISSDADRVVTDIAGRSITDAGGLVTAKEPLG